MTKDNKDHQVLNNNSQYQLQISILQIISKNCGVAEPYTESEENKFTYWCVFLDE